MEPFATAEQYEARYGEVDDPELLSEVLMDATRLIASELERSGRPVEGSGEEAAERRMQVCRSVAFRTMAQELEGDGPSIPAGATQYSQGTGIYTASVTMGNPYRDVYLTKAERRMLGIGRGRIGFSMPGGDGDDTR